MDNTHRNTVTPLYWLCGLARLQEKKNPNPLVGCRRLLHSVPSSFMLEKQQYKIFSPKQERILCDFGVIMLSCGNSSLQDDRH